MLVIPKYCEDHTSPTRKTIELEPVDPPDTNQKPNADKKWDVFVGVLTKWMKANEKNANLETNLKNNFANHFSKPASGDIRDFLVYIANIIITENYYDAEERELFEVIYRGLLHVCVRNVFHDLCLQAKDGNVYNYSYYQSHNDLNKLLLGEAKANKFNIEYTPIENRQSHGEESDNEGYYRQHLKEKLEEVSKEAQSRLLEYKGQKERENEQLREEKSKADKFFQRILRRLFGVGRKNYKILEDKITKNNEIIAKTAAVYAARLKEKEKENETYAKVQGTLNTQNQDENKSEVQESKSKFDNLLKELIVWLHHSSRMASYPDWEVLSTLRVETILDNHNGNFRILMLARILELLHSFANVPSLEQIMTAYSRAGLGVLGDGEREKTELFYAWVLNLNEKEKEEILKRAANCHVVNTIPPPRGFSPSVFFLKSNAKNSRLPLEKLDGLPGRCSDKGKFYLERSDVLFKGLESQLHVLEKHKLSEFTARPYSGVQGIVSPLADLA